jgi:hypothetical protein
MLGVIGRLVGMNDHLTKDFERRFEKFVAKSLRRPAEQSVIGKVQTKRVLYSEVTGYTNLLPFIVEFKTL